MDARLIIDTPGGGVWNMALDEALLESAPAAGRVGLRFYGWSEPTVSLGYFQAYRSRREHEASGASALVRRSTGGGAILHDRELTYSFTAPLSHRFSPAAQFLYTELHQTLVDELASWGVRALLCEAPRQRQPHEEPFLCFQRRTSGDVLLADAKIAGSAQRRHKGALLQHGSLLLQTSPRAPELAGLEELSGIRIEPAELIRRWTSRLAQRLGLNFSPAKATEREVERAERLQAEKFGCEQWTRRR